MELSEFAHQIRSKLGVLKGVIVDQKLGYKLNEEDLDDAVRAMHEIEELLRAAEKKVSFRETP